MSAVAIVPEQPTGSDRTDQPPSDTPRTIAVAGRAARILNAATVNRLHARAVLGPAAPTKPVVGPMTGQRMYDLRMSTTADVDRAFAQARAVRPGWAALPVAAREAILLRFHDLALRHTEELLDLVQLESGKARHHAFEEIADVALTSRHYGRNARGYLAERRVPGVFPVLSTAEVVRHPKGVVGVVSPWNYPLTLAVSDALAALVAGNAVVLRPDSLTSMTALRAVELLDDAGLPPGVLQVVLGSGGTVGQAVFDRADYVCFTGSTPTGRTVAAGAGQRLIGASLELGGKNPLIVRADADLDKAVRGAARGVYASGGQLCMSIERIVVDRAIEAEFTRRFVAMVGAMRLGPELTYENDMGSLLNDSQLRIVGEHIADAVGQGATVLAGGRPRPDIGPWFHEPTVLAGVTPAMRVYREETFGPLVSIYPVDGDDQAVALANDTPFGLNASIFTRDVRAGRAMARQVKAGTVNINEGYAAGWAAMHAPMGGMKDSGLGRRHGAEGIHKYTEPQTIAVQRLTDLGAPPAVGNERWAQWMALGLKGMKRIGRR